METIRQPRKHSEVRKCSECRRDKRKCLPEKRQWPGQICKACERYGYTCSMGLTAKESRTSRSPHEATRETSACPPVYAGGDLLPPVRSDITRARQTGHTLETAPESAASPTTVAQRSSSSGVFLQQDPNLTLVEPSNHRVRGRTTHILQERLAVLWGSKSTYEFVCSTRFTNTISDLFSYSVRQIAETDNMVNAALLAFCAADSTINTRTTLAQEFRVESWKQMSVAYRSLQGSLVDWPRFEGRDFLAPMATIFLLAAYGICADEPELLRVMTGLLTLGRTRSAIFPIAMEFWDLPGKGWRMRIYLADDPNDSGLICGHDTNLFDVARDEFTTAVLGPGIEESERFQEI